jgi:hypothetical protein
MNLLSYPAKQRGGEVFSPLLESIERLNRGGVEMKKSLAPLLIFCSLIFLMGMGEIGGTAPVDKIPVPNKNFTARIVDSQGVETHLSQFSYEGKVFLVGKRGGATVTIPFEKISQLQLQGREGNDLLAKVSLRDQKSIEIKMAKRAKFFGQAEFGTFQIEVKDLRSINFHP